MEGPPGGGSELSPRTDPGGHVLAEHRGATGGGLTKSLCLCATL